MPTPTKTQLTGGSFQDAEGNLLVNGYLEMMLSQDENITGVGNICAGITIRIQLDSAGNVAGTGSTPPVAAQSVWANDVMLPINSYYRVAGFTSKGQKAFGTNNQQVVSGGVGGGTFNTDTWVPNTVFSWQPPLQPLDVEVEGTQFSSESVLDFVNTGNVTFTDEGNGQLSANAPGVVVPPPSFPQPDVANFAMWSAQNGGGGPGDFYALFDEINFTGGTIHVAPTATHPAMVWIQNGAVNGQNGGGWFWPTRGIVFKTALISLATNASGTSVFGLSQAVTGTAVENPVTGAYDGILCGYIQTSSSALGNWLLIVNIGGSSTTYDSGVPVVANAFTKLEILVNSGVATLYVNGTATPATTSTLPTANPLLMVLYQTTAIDTLVAYLYAQNSTP